MATTPIITNVYPAPGAKGIVLADQIKVWFDQEMDETSINSGTFVVTGPDNDFIFGPDFNPLDQPGIEDEGILNSPYYPGFVAGEITFKRVDVYGAEVDTVDYAGTGSLYRTLAIFTPDKLLAPGVTYTVIIAGDETPTDDFDTGAKTRTVFDTEKVSVSGSGDLTFGGGFTGSINRTYLVEITTGGPTGQAEYIWWEDSNPLTTFPGITTTGRRLLENGVWIECSADGNFSTGDQFRVICVPAIVLEGNYTWSFETGSGSIAIPPSDSSASGIGDLVSSTDGGLRVISIVPKNRSTNLDPDSVSEIIITFSGILDESTITDDTITIWTEPVNGDFNSDIEYAGKIAKILSVDGNTLTVQIS